MIHSLALLPLLSVWLRAPLRAALTILARAAMIINFLLQPLTWLFGADSSTNNGEAKVASLPLRILNSLRDVIKFFIQDGVMYVKGKAYKPTHPETVQLLIAELQGLISESGPGSWKFCDLGCGEGRLLPDMRRAGLFERIVGVELDEETYKQAITKVADPSIELVCADMFKYVEDACAKGDFARTVVYIYEPLWRAGLPLEVVHQLYERFLENIATQRGAVVVYITGTQWHERHVPTSMFEKHGFVLRRGAQVTNSGVANALSGTYNTLEMWQTGS